MSHFRLLNTWSTERAAAALFHDLDSLGLLRQLPAAVAQFKKEPGSVDVVGFDIFDPYEGRNAPHRWLVGKPCVTQAELLRIYERAALQPRYGHESVAEIVCKAFPKGFRRRLVQKLGDVDAWLSPVRMLMASSLSVGAEVVERGHTVKVQLGNAFMEVGPLGAWSNRIRETVENFGDDPGTPIGVFPAITSEHPLVRALVALAGDKISHSAINVIAHGLDEGVITPGTAESWSTLSGDLIRRVIRPILMEDQEAALIDHVQQVLSNRDMFDLTDLFDAAVPRMLSFGALQRIAGAPTQWAEGRRLSQRTADIWFAKMMEEYRLGGSRTR